MKGLPILWVVGLPLIFSCNPPEITSVEELHTTDYSEPLRPQLHFTPPVQWMNDPNGMVYFEGEYHLFYQHYPDSNVWGPMHWGHAISSDMISWQQQPIALYPDSLGYIFSGSAVIDWQNTSGFGDSKTPPMVAVYTYHDPVLEGEGNTNYQYQGIAYSLDNGRSWTKYDQNPVLDNPGIADFRDPKVSWHQATEKWIMTLAVKDHISFYSSPDLKVWTFESDFGLEFGSHGGVWECPDLFELPVNGNDTSAWVLLVSIGSGGPNGGSATQYFTGTFDGTVFKPNESPEEVKWIDYGADNYAGVTWSDIPAADGRRIFMGWMSNWMYAQAVPTTEWRSAMTLPRVLSLDSSQRGLQLVSTVVEELNDYQTESTPSAVPSSTKGEQVYSIDSLSKITFQTTVGDSVLVTLKNGMDNNLVIILDRTNGKVRVDRSRSGQVGFHPDFGTIHEAPYAFEDTLTTVQMFLDVGSLELFVDGGKLVFSEIFFPEEPLNKLAIEATDVQDVKIYSFQSIWAK